MRLYIHAFAFADNCPDQEMTTERHAWPKPGTNRKGGRLPKLASDLARLALGDREDNDNLAVIFGTSLGALTETELFVSHMIKADEATPKPRAFTASVHNAIASQTALALGARGECQTFVHADLALAHCVFAAECIRRREPDTGILIGSFDEAPTGQFAELAAASETEISVEDAAVFYLAPTSDGAIASLDTVAFAHPESPEAWLADKAQGLPQNLVMPSQSLAGALAASLQRRQSAALIAKSGTEHAVLRLHIT